jgi:hypothetical protein
MASYDSLYDASFAVALAAFKRDCNENRLIARLLRDRLNEYLLEPVLDVGAGSGELASLAFPDRASVLLDVDRYKPSANVRHARITGDFARTDLAGLHPKSILFCHSMNALAHDVGGFSRRLVSSGAKAAIIVSNEETGILKQMTDWLSTMLSDVNTPFHIPLAHVRLEKKQIFSARISCADFHTMTGHFVRVLLDIPVTPSLVNAVEQKLKSLLSRPCVDITEAIYYYRLNE